MDGAEASRADRPVLVLDDGELDDVRALLHDLGVEYANAPLGSGAAADLRLLIATPRYLVGPGADRLASTCVATRRIAIWEGGARTLRAQLERSQCDFVVERPIHPAALRLLVVHALYEGPEQRRRPRVAMGDPVKLRAGLRSRQAIMVQLSARGAGLVAPHPPKVGETLKLVLPAKLTRSGSHALDARVIDVAPETADGDGTAFSVVFPGISSASQSILVQIMRSRPRVSVPAGPRPRSGDEPAAPSKSAAPEPAAAIATGPRRASPRKRYQRAVLATGQGRAMPLLGRDVSVGGMRVAPTRAISVGAELKLAVYGPPGVPPVVVEAVVSRGDDESGWVLQFQRLDPARREALESLVRSLPVLASPLRGDEGLSPVAISEIVEKTA
jgi:hypothetical protein